MFGFVSSKSNKDTKEIEKLNVLCVSEKGFRDFLRLWVKWLDEMGITKDLAA